jgi:hypothetical protein
MTGEIMGPSEIADLAAADSLPVQARWLKERGIPHRIEGRGTRKQRLVVSRFHVRQWIEHGTRGASAQANWTTVR